MDLRNYRFSNNIKIEIYKTMKYLQIPKIGNELSPEMK